MDGGFVYGIVEDPEAAIEIRIRVIKNQALFKFWGLLISQVLYLDKSEVERDIASASERNSKAPQSGAKA